MAANSKIEWTEASINVTTGCTEKSPGCANCYARGMSKRLGAMAAADVAKGKNPGKKAAYSLAVLDNGRWSGIVQPIEDALLEPLRWKTPRRIFVNSMSDLFWGDDRDLHDARRRGVEDPKPVPFSFIDKVIAMTQLAHWHTYIILTKRVDRMAEYFTRKDYPERAVGYITKEAVAEAIIAWHAANAPSYEQSNRLPIHPLVVADDVRMWRRWSARNLLIGCSVENQQCADERREPMRRLADAGWATWVSNEPALGPIDWMGWEFLRWLVSGGESGHNARPSHPRWHRTARDFCAANAIPWFFKQWGEFVPTPFIDSSVRSSEVVCINAEGKPGDSYRDGVRLIRVGKHAAGRMLDGRTHDAFPEIGGAR